MKILSDMVLHKYLKTEILLCVWLKNNSFYPAALKGSYCRHPSERAGGRQGRLSGP